MQDHVVAFSNYDSGFILQGRRGRLHQVEQPLPARSDVGAVLDVAGRPVPFGGRVIPLVEERVERFEGQGLVPGFFRLAHVFPPIGRVRAFAASSIATALAPLPSFETSCVGLPGPRLLLSSTSCPALRRCIAKAWATS